MTRSDTLLEILNSGVGLLETLRILMHVAAGWSALAGLYLAKCAAGINLLPGPAPLFHDLLYHFIR